MTAKTATKPKLYTAQATATNFYNWLHTYTITQEDLDELYDGDADLWLEAIELNNVEPASVRDEGDGGDIQVDEGSAHITDEPDHSDE